MVTIHMGTPKWAMDQNRRQSSPTAWSNSFWQLGWTCGISIPSDSHQCNASRSELPTPRTVYCWSLSPAHDWSSDIRQCTHWTSGCRDQCAPSHRSWGVGREYGTYFGKSKRNSRERYERIQRQKNERLLHEYTTNQEVIYLFPKNRHIRRYKNTC